MFPKVDLTWVMYPSAPPHAQKSSKNEMLIFGLHSTSDDWPSDWREESHLKCEKMAAKLSKTEMLVFGLRSTSDGWLSYLSNTSCPKGEKWPPNHQKLNAHFQITFNF